MSTMTESQAQARITDLEQEISDLKYNVDRDGKLHRPDQAGRNYAERLTRIEKAIDILLGRANLAIGSDGEVADPPPPPVSSSEEVPPS
jgi:heme oxygenase